MTHGLVKLIAPLLLHAAIIETGNIQSVTMGKLQTNKANKLRWKFGCMRSVCCTNDAWRTVQCCPAVWILSVHIQITVYTKAALGRIRCRIFDPCVSLMDASIPRAINQQIRFVVNIRTWRMKKLLSALQTPTLLWVCRDVSATRYCTFLAARKLSHRRTIPFSCRVYRALTNSATDVALAATHNYTWRSSLCSVFGCIHFIGFVPFHLFLVENGIHRRLSLG